ncbi:hypothetical protein ABU162_25545 [Paenibacillus thiaminolyticus]|uniref:hypothetical protein n=1 Tax=Paenibacillus thiaminolyticus TaxID=49283 RepID=UPI0035A58CA5
MAPLLANGKQEELEMDYFSGKRRLLQRSPSADRYRRGGRAEAVNQIRRCRFMARHRERQQRYRNATQWN